MADTNNQTIAYLGRRLSEAGVRLNSRHGQNFLIDGNLLRLIVERANVAANDVVLEVGTGTGALTGLLASRAAAVVSVEIDPRLYQLAREEMVGLGNVVLLCEDALQTKSQINPRVIAAIEEQLVLHPAGRLKLVANLPYNAATPVIANLLLSPIVPQSMTVTLQKELADRIVAQPGTKDYGALSVWVQSQCRVEIVRVLPPTVFWPRPQVTSAIVHIEPDKARRAAIGELEYFHEFTRSLFFHRRKRLPAALASAWRGHISKPTVELVLCQLGISNETRAEQLDVPSILRLSQSLRDTIRGRQSA